MGIADRDYARTEGRRPLVTRPPGVGRLGAMSVNTWLIVINTGIFVLMGLSPVLRGFLYTVGHFSTLTGFGRLEVWRLVTFQFLHANLLHLAFNMFGLWIFGSLVEGYLGRRKYLAFYLVCGIFGGLMYLTLNLAGILGVPLPGVLNIHQTTQLVGASAGVFGVIMACAYIDPKSVVDLLFPPISIRMRTLAYGYVALALYNLLVGGSNAGGDAAHVGGAIAGFFFIRNSHLLVDFFDVLNDSRKAATRQGPSEAELDRVLAKTRRDGLASLNTRERRVLAEASKARRARAG